MSMNDTNTNLEVINTVVRFPVAPVEEVAANADLPAERLQHARDLVEGLQQNGRKLSALEGQQSVAHVAASIPDRAFLLAIYEQGGRQALIIPDADGRTPAHYLALQATTETEARKALTLLSNLGVSMTAPNAPGQTAPIQELLDAPGWREQWIMFRARNAEFDELAQSTRLETFLALLRSRARMRAVKRHMKSLG